MRHCTNRKDNIFMQSQLYIDKLHMALDVFCFEVFLVIEVIEVDDLDIQDLLIIWFNTSSHQEKSDINP